MPSVFEDLSERIGVPVQGRLPTMVVTRKQIGTPSFYTMGLTLDLRERSPADLTTEPDLWRTVAQVVDQLRSTSPEDPAAAVCIYTKESDVDLFLWLNSPTSFDCWIAARESWSLLRRAMTAVHRKPDRAITFLPYLGERTLVMRVEEPGNDGKLDWTFLLLQEKLPPASVIDAFFVDAIEATPQALSFAAITLGTVYEAAKEYKSAIHFLEKERRSRRTASAPKLTQALLLESLALAYWHEGVRETAISLFQEILSLGERAASTHYNLGTACMDIGDETQLRSDYQMAEEHFRSALAEEPEHYSALYNLCCVMALQGRKEAALREIANSRIASSKILEELSTDKDWLASPADLIAGPAPSPIHTFDFALSFAGSERALAREIANALKDAGFAVFIDEDFEHEMLGVDGGQYLRDVYTRKSRFCVVLISRQYDSRTWTQLERESIQARELLGEPGILIPVRVEDHAPDWLPASRIFFNLSERSLANLVELLRKKASSLLDASKH